MRFSLVRFIRLVGFCVIPVLRFIVFLRFILNIRDIGKQLTTSWSSEFFRI